MERVTWSDLKKVPADSYRLLDVREPGAFRRGSLPGAANIPEKELYEKWDGAAMPDGTITFTREYEAPVILRADKPVFVICHNGGLVSSRAAGWLEGKGMKAGVLAGGWRRYLAAKLEEEAAAPDLFARTREIERSIIKKYRRPIWRQVTKAVHDYQLIHAGDRIACCISGGKDSMLMAKILQELQRHGNVPFDLVFLTMNPGYHTDNWSIVQSNAKILGIPLKTFDSHIFDAVDKIDRNPCYLCARMRRGNLYANARDLGCNKIALGHHFDDVIETVLMGMFFAGKFETMMPKLHSRNFPGMELIRPLYLVHEEDILAWRDYNHLHFIQCACRFTENYADNRGTSRRDDMKKLIASLKEMDPTIPQNILNSTKDVSLNTIMGWHTHETSCNFLDDYDKRQF